MSLSIEQSKGPATDNCYHNPPIHVLMLPQHVRIPRNAAIQVEQLRFFLREGTFEPSLSDFRGTLEGFKLLQQHTDPLYYSRPFEERLEVAFRLIDKRGSPKLIETALGVKVISSRHLTTPATCGRTLVGVVAHHIGYLTSEVLEPSVCSSTYNTNEYELKGMRSKPLAFKDLNNITKET